jgi:TrwC relaxase
MAVVVTVAKGYDLDYVRKNQGQPGPERSTGGYYINAAQAGEPPGRWWGPGADALGFTPGKLVERKPYEAVYEQIDPVPARSSAGPAAATRNTPTTSPG